MIMYLCDSVLLLYITLQYYLLIKENTVFKIEKGGQKKVGDEE